MMLTWLDEIKKSLCLKFLEMKNRRSPMILMEDRRLLGSHVGIVRFTGRCLNYCHSPNVIIPESQ